jgi:molecular chaperone GrpE
VRSTADFDNYRKRTLRDQDKFKTQAEKKIISDFINVMDNFERAIAHAKVSTDFDTLLHGVELTSKMFIAALAKHGCTSFNSLGEQFDPNYHDVLSKVDDATVPHNSIVQEHLKGYIMQGSLLRPALVVVAQTPDETEGAEASEQPEVAEQSQPQGEPAPNA